MDRRVVIVGILLLMLCTTVGVASAWGADMGAWEHRKGITLNNTGAELTDYQVMFTVNRSAGSDSGFTVYLDGKCEEDYDDIRFTTSDEETLCDYWIESSSSTVATIWVEVPTIAAGNTIIYLYYGNAAASAVSNGETTFPFFDDFQGSSLDTNKWVSESIAGGSGSVSVSGGICTISYGGSNGWQLYSKTAAFGVNYAFRTMANLPGASAYSSLGFSDAGELPYRSVIYTHYPTNNVFNAVNNNPHPTASSRNIGSGHTGYKVWDIYRNSTTSTIFKESESVVATLTTNVPTANEKVYFSAQGQTIYIKWVLVRKCTATEPTVSAWGSEETHSEYIPPVANFTSNATSGYMPFAVLFEDTSTGTPTTWDWYFPNGGDGHTENSTWTFDYVIGNSITQYDVYLNASNADGYDWENKTDYIIAYPLNASFTVNDTSISFGSALLFTDLTDNGTATSWNWSFGDGNYSSLQNPEYIYSINGTYDITLNASNLYSWDIETKLAYITVYPPIYGLHTLGIYGNTSTVNVSFYGSSDITSDYWFEFSGTPEGFTMATDTENITAGDPVVIKSPRVPFIDNTTYYYRIAREDANGTVSYGETLTFTAESVAPIPTTTYKEEYYKPFVRAKWNLTELAGIVPVPYFAKFGYVLWAIFWGAILMAFWVRQEDVTIPSFMYLIIFFTLNLADLLPSSFVAVSWVFAGICFGAILYTLFRGRKHG